MAQIGTNFSQALGRHHGFSSNKLGYTTRCGIRSDGR
jgi:hypothetical protein